MNAPAVHHALTPAQRERLPGLSEAEVDDAIRAQREHADETPTLPIDELDDEHRQVAGDVEPWGLDPYAPSPRDVGRWDIEGAVVGAVVFLIVVSVYWSELAQLRALLLP